MYSNEKLSICNLISDIRDLYCKTGNKKIEGIFIALSQSNNQEIFKWIASNRKIKNNLKDPEVYEALMVLIGLRKEYPSVPTPDNPTPLPFGKSDVVKKVMGSPVVNKRTPYFLAFYPIIRDPRVSDILSPFEDILRSFHETLSQQKNPMSSSSVVDDLSDINEQYKKSLIKEDIPEVEHKPEVEYFPKRFTKPTKKQKKQSMYEYLRDRFTQDISSAASRSQFIELAKKISAEMILITPMALTNYLKVPITNDIIDAAKIIAKEIFKRTDDENKEFNYEMVKSVAMKKSGMISPSQLLDFYSKKEKYDVEKLTGNNPKYPSISIQDSQWINPKFILLIGCVIYLLKGEIEKD